MTKLVILILTLTSCGIEPQNQNKRTVNARNSADQLVKHEPEQLNRDRSNSSDKNASETGTSASDAKSHDNADINNDVLIENDDNASDAVTRGPENDTSLPAPIETENNDSPEMGPKPPATPPTTPPLTLPSGGTSTPVIAAGFNHICALVDQKVECLGSIKKYSQPSFDMPRLLASYGDRSCVVDNNGLTCWGNLADLSYQIYEARLSSEKCEKVNGTIQCSVSNISRLSMGEMHVCYAQDKSVRCFGNNSFGQSNPRDFNFTVQVLSTGKVMTCVLSKVSGFCWGIKGHNNETLIPTLSEPTAMSLFYQHGCVLDGKEVKCWGGHVPGKVSEISVASPRLITTGKKHTCVADTNHQIICSGDNQMGQLSIPTTQISDLTAVEAMSAGMNFTCLIGRSKSSQMQKMICWGETI